ncbi:MAG: hypothetical protein QXG98_00545 [Candidatus Micrarchaeia archaeon]
MERQGCGRLTIVMAALLVACVTQPPPAAAAFASSSRVSFHCSNPSFEQIGFSRVLKLEVNFKNEGSMLASGCARVQVVGKNADVLAEKLTCSRLLFPGETQAVRVEVAAPIGSSPASYACVR